MGFFTVHVGLMQAAQDELNIGLFLFLEQGMYLRRLEREYLRRL